MNFSAVSYYNTINIYIVPVTKLFQLFYDIVLLKNTITKKGGNPCMIASITSLNVYLYILTIQSLSPFVVLLATEKEDLDSAP